LRAGEKKQKHEKRGKGAKNAETQENIQLYQLGLWHSGSNRYIQSCLSLLCCCIFDLIVLYVKNVKLSKSPALYQRTLIYS
jgi:hypothetical protein